jgi:hypothetical protein
VVVFNLTPISESDFWIQLEVGDMIRGGGTIPRTIEFAFTEARDREFIAHEWLPSTLSSALYARIGYGGMIVFKCALALGVAALAFALAFQVGGNAVASALIACAVATAMNFRFQMRPEIFAFLLALTTLNLLARFAITGRRAWLVGLAPVALIWANAHGSFLLNLALPWMVVLGGLIDDAWSRRLADPQARTGRLLRFYLPLAAAGAVMFALSLANPFGLRLFTHALEFSRADWLRDFIVEFGSTFDERVRRQPYFAVYAAYLGLVLLSFVRARGRLDGTSIVLTVAFGWMSLDAIRFTAWFALAGTWALGHNLAHLGRGPAGVRRLAIAGIIALAAGIGIVVARGDVRGHPVGFGNEAPMSAAALEFLRASGVEGNVFNTFSHGDQLIHAFYPRIRVVIDSRIDAYGEDYYKSYLALVGRSYRALGPPADLLAFLDRHDVHAIVTRPLDFGNWTEKGHGEALARAGWNVVFADAGTVVLRRPRRQPRNPRGSSRERPGFTRVRLFRRRYDRRP